MKKIALALVAALSLGVLAGCGGGAGGSGGGKTLEIVAGDGGALQYSPTTLSVKKGEKVTVHLTNKDTAQAHTFIVKDLNVKSAQVAPGKDANIPLTADKAGSFEFHCDVPGHEATMKGTLTVTE